ncbi:twin-arginine translocase subunit TatC, partial [Rhizobium hidalgonense]
GAASKQAIQQSTQLQLSQQAAKQQDATQQESPQKEQLINMPLTGHLIELRRRLARILGVVIVLFFVLLPFANQLYEGLSQPLRAQLPANATMIATDVTATFMAPFKLNFF